MKIQILEDKLVNQFSLLHHCSSYYLGRNKKLTNEELDRLKKSRTIYIQDFPKSFTEKKFYALFSNFPIRNIWMGRNRNSYEGSDFALIEFFSRESALKVFFGYKYFFIDKKLIRIDIDIGYDKDREYGRGSRGGRKAQEKYEDKIQEKNKIFKENE